MKLKKTIKRMVALGTGAIMVGATVMGAMAAADLQEYPAPFVVDGQFDALIVVGEGAAVEDVVGSIDVATSLQYANRIERELPGGDTGTVIEGDNAKFVKNNDILELKEPLGAVKTTLDASDLDMLQTGEISTSKGSTGFKQYLTFNDSTLGQGELRWTKNDDDVEGDFLYFDEDEVIFEYKLEFEEGLESDIDTTAKSLEDIEDEEIFMLGNVYSIVDTVINGNALTLDLIGGDVTDTLEEGQSKTYTIDGVDYEVEALIISDTSANSQGTVMLKINGEVTNELEEGETDRLSDGTEVGIRTIIPNEAGETTGGDLVEFYLGANKLKLKDGDYTDGAYGSSGTKVEVAEENIEQAGLNIKATNSTGDEISISYIKYNLKAESPDGNVWVPEGEGLRAYLKEPQGLLSETWDIEYHGLTVPVDDMDHRSEVKFSPSGDDAYYLEFVNEAGAEYRFPLVDTEGTFKWGSDDDDLWFVEPPAINSAANYTISKKDYFVLMDKENVDDGVVSNVLRYTSIDDSERRITFTDEAGGTIDMIYDGTVSTLGTGGASGELTIAGTTHTVYVYSADASNYYLAVDLNADGVVGNDTAYLVVNGGGYLNLDAAGNVSMSAPTSAVQGHPLITLVTQSDNFDENSFNRNTTSGDEMIAVSITEASATELDIDLVDGYMSGSNGPFVFEEQDDDNNDLKRSFSYYGVYGEQMNQDNDPDTLSLWYPDEQVSAEVYVTGGDTTVSSVGGENTYDDVIAIDVGAAVLDSEVRDVAAQNLIVVGGPCANTVAMEVMGNPSPCGVDFTEGEAMIKLFETGEGNVALLVAGYDALDTRRASRVLAQYTRYDLSGTEVVVTGTSLSDIDVSAPVVVE